MSWLITGFSLLGIALNILKNRICFVVWFGTNASWCVIDLLHGIHSQAVLMGIYCCFSVWGFLRWKEEVRHV